MKKEIRVDMAKKRIQQIAKKSGKRYLKASKTARRPPHTPPKGKRKKKFGLIDWR